MSDTEATSIENTKATEDEGNLPASLEDAVPTGDIPDIGTSSDPEESILYKRADIEKLRQEAGKYRQRAHHADELAQRLHTELVRATGKLADPTDLPFSADHLADADTMVQAIEDLLTRKPHLASRRLTGDIGQGATSVSAGTVDLAAILRQRAG